jgi:hypothetical protein
MTGTKRAGRVRFWIGAVSLIVASVLLGTYLYQREVSTGECHDWQRALAELSESTAGLGTATSRQFRQEAIRRGWVDTGGGRLVYRPAGCTP